MSSIIYGWLHSTNPQARGFASKQERRMLLYAFISPILVLRVSFNSALFLIVSIVSRILAVFPCTMRLLKCSTLLDSTEDKVTLQEYFTISQCPAYAILSHTWGEEEVIFQDVQRDKSTFEHKKGYSKVRGCCSQAMKDGYEWVSRVSFLDKEVIGVLLDG
jgi:hypothetical protein